MYVVFDLEQGLTIYWIPILLREAMLYNWFMKMTQQFDKVI